MILAWLVPAALALFFAAVAWRVRVAAQRDKVIRHQELPRGLFDQLRKKYPALTAKDCQLVAAALRQYFLAYAKSGRQQVAMPSQVVDDLWHEFILFTRNYQVFCQQAFGHFLHHTPAAAMGGAARSDAALQRCWQAVCREENIHPARPSRLPLLFAIDSKLHIAKGFHYAVDCTVQRTTAGTDGQIAVVHCATDLRASERARQDGGCSGGGSFSAGASGDAPGAADASSCSGGSSGCGGGGCSS